MSDLIDWLNVQWDRGLIDAVFHEFDAKAIYRIPLSRHCVLDVLVWLHNKKGRCLVKSGYYVARRLLCEASQVGERSDQMSSSMVWARIWKLHIPNKIKAFG